MDIESAQTIVDLLVRIEARLEALEKRLDGIRIAPEEPATTRPTWSGVDRRSAQQPITHDERRKLSGEI